MSKNVPRPNAITRVLKKHYLTFVRLFDQIKIVFAQGHFHSSTSQLGQLVSYPATRLSRLPWQKLAIRFCDEAILVLFALAIISVSVFGRLTADTSLAATALSRHPKQNLALYGRLFSTKTVVTQKGLIAEAQAEEIPDIQRPLETTPTPPAITSIDESGLFAAIPDSAQSLVNNQIQVYDTQAGDTLAAIAQRFGISTNTIKWANGLTADQIKPGWHLVIPTVNGVLVKADSNTTIPDIAHKFKCSIERIISFNGLSDAEDIEPGQLVMCPDGELPAPPKPKTIATPAKRSVGIAYADIPDEAGSTHIFAKGNCTWYVARKFHVTWGGDAKYWLKNAAEAGYRTGQVPQAGAVVVTSENGKHGHVALVEKIDHANGTMTISEMNYKGLGIVDSRELPLKDGVVRGFIYAN